MSRHRNPSISLNPQTFFSLADLSMLPPELSKHKKHFTASAVVMEQSHILLVHHRRIGAWLPPGGHIEENEFPHQAAVRETKEETGVDITPLSTQFPATGNVDAFFLPTPLCIHAVKARENDLDYYHIDLAYLCVPVMRPANKDHFLPAINTGEEVYESRWVDLNHLSSLPMANNVVEIVSLAKSRLNLT